MLSNEATRPEPVYGPPPEGFRWAAHPAGPDWRTETERQCRRMHGTVRGRTRCTRQAVAALNRPRRVSWRNPVVIDSWWAYCPDHMYGRWVEDGRVMEYRAEPVGEVQVDA